jgi:DNA invertase Pin-like site-specific DNA recombinase
MSYVIYARKSTESADRQVLSIDSQIRELKAIAARQGIEVARVLTESHSAKAPGRPVFGMLMKEAAAGKIRGVLAWKMDRLARNHLDTGLILQALADGKLERVITIDRTYTRDGNDRFIGNFELGMATKYIDDLRQNVKRGNRARFARGWVNHNPPLGYLLDPATKTIVKDPERFDRVRRMWELLLTRAVRPEEIHRIAKDDWGFRTRRFKRIGGGPLSRTSLYRIFESPFYMGLIRLRNGETYQGAHPPMVTREEFDATQELLGRPGRARPQRHSFPFAGILHCGRCGGMATAEAHVKPSGRRYVYYHCGRRKAGASCPYEAISSQDLESQVTSFLARLTIPPRALAWMQKTARRDLETDRERTEQAVAMARASLNELEGEANTLLSIRLRDLVDDATFLARKRQIEERRVLLQAKVQGPQRSVEELNKLAAATFDFAAKAAQVFVAGTGVQKRMILEAVGSNYTLEAKKVALEFTKPFQLIAETAHVGTWSACWDDVRTWIQDTAEYFKLPNLIQSTIAELSSTGQVG